MPFGEEITRGSYASDSLRQKFTGYERDGESGLDYAKARMFGSCIGRFTTPDNFVNDTHVLDPQSWNLYAYARNNPLKFIDKSGNEILIAVWELVNGQLSRSTAFYTSSGLTNSDGTKYEGDNKTIALIASQLNKLSEFSSEVNAYANDSKNRISIEAGDSDTLVNGSVSVSTGLNDDGTTRVYSTISYDPTRGEFEGGPADAFVALGRELLGTSAQAIQNGGNILIDEELLKTETSFISQTTTLTKTLLVEKNIRAFFGIAPRTSFNGSVIPVSGRIYAPDFPTMPGRLRGNVRPDIAPTRIIDNEEPPTRFIPRKKP
jgi:RHS repeat-associated protein